MRLPDLSKTILKRSPYRSVGIGWLKEKMLKHDDSTHLKSIEACGVTIYYTSSEELIHCLKEIFFENCYAFHSSQPKPVVFDCGSHIGMSILNIKRQYPQARVFAFEPDPSNCTILEKNIREWGLEDVEIFQNPVWISDEEIEFEASGAMGGKIVQSNQGGATKTKFKAKRLSSLIIDKIDLLKIDIEGAEYEVLLDCKSKLHLVENLFVEYHSTFADEFKLIEILNVLKDSGFNFYLKEANNVFPVPFKKQKINTPFDLQLNIFAFRDNG